MIHKNKVKGFVFIILSVFTLGIFENIFHDNEEVDKEYAMIKEFVSGDEYFSTKYGKIISFSDRPSFRQYVDSSVFNLSVQYQNNQEVYLECKILKADGKSSLKYIKEYEGNFSLIKNTFNKI